MTEVPSVDEQPDIDEVLPPKAVDLAVPIDLDRLQPWHRPRKQYVREHQWVRFAERLIRREKGSPQLRADTAGPPEVRYLTLPEIDYLDVRLIADTCRTHDCLLTTTGFIGTVQSAGEVARAKMREQSLIDAGHISDRSATRPSRFEDLAVKNSQAYLDVQQKGPFHIVNVDACGSLAPPSAGTRRLIEAVRELVMFQLEYKTGAWLLYVTTDARPESVAQDTVRSLWRYVESNARGDRDFHDQVLSLFELDADADISATPALVDLPGESFLKLLSLGLGKWLLALAEPYNFGLHAHPAYCYSTAADGQTPTMACLAYEFVRRPRPTTDRFCVIKPDPQADGGPPQPTDSGRVAQAVSNMTNVDVAMDERRLRLRMIQNTQVLLVDAGYPPEVVEGLSV